MPQSPRTLRRRAAAAALVALAISGGAIPARAQSSQTIEAILVEGASRLSQEAFLHLLSVKVGEPLDETKVRADFRTLWDRKLFDDLSVESRRGEKGMVLIYHVVERPLLTSVDYSDIKILSRTQMEDKLREKNVELKVGSPVDYAAIKKAEDLIRNGLAEKGFLDAQVATDLQEVSGGARSLLFKIQPGVKTRIRRIDFTGNHVFSDRRLKRSLQHTHEHSWLRALKGGSTYHPLVFDQDLDKVRQLYLDRGFIDVQIKPAAVSVEEGRPRKKESKRRKWLSLSVPVDEGRFYKVGKITTEGNTVFGEQELIARIPLKPGMVYNGSLMQAGTSTIEFDYGERGYFYVSTNPRLTRHDDGTVDINLRVDEDQRYFVNRIEFLGNTTTRDKVLRRELQLNEEEIFNLKKFRLGIRRINQLGYWQLTQEPQIRPLEGESKVDVSIHGQEQGRNEIQFGGGYSGIDGGFFTSSYATRNFLGLGEIVTSSAQLGARASRYNIAFEEPYFLGKPVTLGFSLFKRDTRFVDFTQSGSGLSATLGRRIANFQAIRATYLLENLQISNADFVTGTASSTVTSSIVPMYTINTINNPFHPSRGWQLRLSGEYAGGLLGGDNYFIKPLVETMRYLKAYKKTFFALHGEVGMVDRYGDGLLPLSERFFLGGEFRGPRVFQTRSISPNGFHKIDGTNDCQGKLPDPGNPTDVAAFGILGGLIPAPVKCGGSKYFLAQFEYVLPVGQPLEIALFYDAGNTFLDDEPFSLSRDPTVGAGGLKMSTGIEARFYIPVFQFPLRLIYGFVIDPKEGEDHSSFQFSIGRSF